jgi:CDP-diacylglycerol--serine O-phosphatidyltransferase
MPAVATPSTHLFHPEWWCALERSLARRVPFHPHVISLTKLALVLPILAVLTDRQLTSSTRALSIAALFACFGFLDYLDGAVAREKALDSPLGRVLDRATDLPIVLVLSGAAADRLPVVPLALKLSLDVLLLVLFARGFGSTRNRLRTTVSYACLFAMLMLGQGWGSGVVTHELVDRLLWLNAGVSLLIVLRRLDVLASRRIADALSLANLACGLLSMSFAARGELAISLLLLSLGAGLDGLDGAAARRWGGSRFGVYMDDLADGVSYGLSPGYALYAVLGGLEGALVGAAFACFVIARLVFFTLAKSHGDPGEFRGVPSTIGGLVTLASLVLVPDSALLVGFLVGLACALMVSFDVRHRHLGRALASREARVLALAFAALVALGAALGGLEVAVWIVLTASLTYGFLPSVLAFRALLTCR